MKNIAVILIFLFIISIGIWWQLYAFRDCLKVGHSKVYCIMRIMAK